MKMKRLQKLNQTDSQATQNRSHNIVKAPKIEMRGQEIRITKNKPSAWIQVLLTVLALSHLPKTTLAVDTNGDNGRALSAFNEPCLGVVSDLTSIDRDDLLCQTPSGMLYNISSVGDSWVEQKMLTGELFSGETILDIPTDATLNEQTQTLEMDQPPVLRHQDPEGRHLRQFARTQGNKTVLAVRVEASNSVVSNDEAKISHAIFGGPTDFVNLKSQVYACSHGKLNFQKRPNLNGITTNVRNGVVTIKVDLPIEVGHTKLVNAVSQEIIRQFGMTRMDIADHVMYCLPEGAFNGVGYAIMNKGFSVYNDKLCTSASTQMHEVG